MLVCSAPASAQVFETLGTRALGMGGAFVAVADDATATYWNPAGLASGAFFSLLADHAKFETRGDPSRRDSPGADGSTTIVGMSTNSRGFSYYRLGINQIERSLPPDAFADSAPEGQRGEPTLHSVVTHNVGLTAAQLFSPGFSLGSTIRYVYGSYGIDSGDRGLTTGEWLDQARELERHGQHKVDLDLGVKVGSPIIQAGLVARNLLQPTLSGPDGRTARIDRRFRVGLAVRPVAQLVVAADIDLDRLKSVNGDRQHVAVGAEHWFGEWLGVRGGARVNLRDTPTGPRAVVGAFGLSVALSAGMYLDGQWTRGRDEVERGWSVAGRVGF